MNPYNTIAALVATVALSGVFVAPATQARAAVPASAAGLINHTCGPNYKVYPGNFGSALEKKIGSTTVLLNYQGLAPNYFGEIWNGRPGDTVWMDWSDTPGSWHQCGPFKVPKGKKVAYTKGVNLVDGRYFRACGHHARKTACTHWFG